MSELAADRALDWCATVLGPVEQVSDHSKTHGEHVSSTLRLRASEGFCYLKVHQTEAAWHNEVHAYELWTHALGDRAPRLIAVRDVAPLALVITELPGQIMEQARLSPAQERSVWRDAGAALVALHDLPPGDGFGPCRRDGTWAGAPLRDAVSYMAAGLNSRIERALGAGLLGEDELATLRAALDLAPAFKGERPIACHRDYCPANWLVSSACAWAGVIDFEFAHWDVRLADFTRDPDWCWIRRPDLFLALLEGYGRPFSPAEEQQLLVARADYALGAINWGHAQGYYGFEREGHAALAELAPRQR